MAQLNQKLFTWQESFVTHIESIDRQHQTLVSLIARLQQAMLHARGREQLPGILQELTRYARYHFAWEEQLMEQHGYSCFEEHSRQHEAFCRQVAEFQEQMAQHRLAMGAPVLRFLRAWLVEHILVSDHAYVPFLKEKGVV